MKNSINKMNKDIIPEGITVQMAIIDFLPVLFFGGIGLLLGILVNNILVEASSFLIFISGFLKALWKLIVAKYKKNIWPLFVQMRILMPIGFICVSIGLIYSISKYNYQTIINVLTGLPQLIFFIIGLIGIILMIICSIKLNSADAKSNWIEQIINFIAQASIFFGILFIMINH